LEQLEAAMKMRAAAIEQLRRVHSENENTLIWNNVLLGCVKEETGHSFRKCCHGHRPGLHFK
jgi:hypothetical protein